MHTPLSSFAHTATVTQARIHLTLIPFCFPLPPSTQQGGAEPFVMLLLVCAYAHSCGIMGKLNEGSRLEEGTIWRDSHVIL